MLTVRRVRRLKCGAMAVCFALCPSVWTAVAPPPASVSNSSVKVTLRAGDHAPRIESIGGGQDNAWSNTEDETLPSSVEIDGAPVSVTWLLKPDLGRVDAGKRKVEFVYESAEPHLRLSWIWEARADFGPVEHRIDVENLGAREVWLPMVDSLRVELRTSAPRDLRNFYVEKGAGTPSAQGTHDDAVVEGYRWTGKSSTYAHPAEGEAREIIPIEFVFDAKGSKAGWYAGIEFSGRTRIALERTGDSLNTVLGLNPEPGPFRTRI
jgi:hypothetical protein